MHSPNLSFVFFAALLFLAQACRAQPDVDRAEVERVITVLSADSLEGRQTFTPGIEKAARFLVGEFERVGLEPLDGLDGYEQAFRVYSLTPVESRVSLNGAPVAAGDLFFQAGADSVSWATGDPVEVVRIGPEADFAQAFRELRGRDGDLLVLVDPSHSGVFARYRGFLSGPRRTMELSDGGSAVYVLTSATEADAYAVDIVNEVDELPLANVVGKIAGRRADEYVLFSAHYDHVGIRPGAAPDSIYNGANDDASGVTAVVALAEYFRQMGTPERTLLFALFTAEEMGGYGSRYFSGGLDPDQIVAMFNIEMIGKPAVEGPNTAWITGFDRSDFGEILQRAVEGTVYEFYPDPYPDQNLFYRSDNATLARLGVPAHSISTTPIDVDPDYHQPSDEVETLDLDHLTNTIRAIARGAATIVSGRETPTRVDVSQIE